MYDINEITKKSLGVLARPNIVNAGFVSLPLEVKELSMLYAGPGPSFLNSVN